MSNAWLNRTRSPERTGFCTPGHVPPRRTLVDAGAWRWRMAALDAQLQSRLRQGRQQAGPSANLLQQWRRRPEFAAEDAQVLARAAAARSCAYLRCANLAAEGGPAAGQGVGFSRCSGCRAAWCACSGAAWTCWHSRGAPGASPLPPSPQPLPVSVQLLPAGTATGRAAEETGAESGSTGAPAAPWLPSVPQPRRRGQLSGVARAVRAAPEQMHASSGLLPASSELHVYNCTRERSRKISRRLLVGARKQAASLRSALHHPHDHTRRRRRHRPPGRRPPPAEPGRLLALHRSTVSSSQSVRLRGNFACRISSRLQCGSGPSTALQGPAVLL